MKHNKNHDHAPSAGPQLVPVRFEFTHPTATAVCVAGTFNHWQPEAKTLHPAGGGRWVKETLLPIGTYEYCLVVDGKFRRDPLVQETVPNPFGGRNSILKVANAAEPVRSSTQDLLQQTKKTNEERYEQRTKELLC